MRTGVVEYAWSFILRMESSRNPDFQRKHSVAAWAKGATVDVPPTDEIGTRAREFEMQGIKPSDALHLACAESASCDWFFTVDRGILKKIKNIGSMRVANPVDFVLEGLT